MTRARSIHTLLALLSGTVGLAQCGPVIGTFPYDEGFENDPAWSSGGVNNDWAWGTPAHPVIDAAGEGTKAWCAGGLTGQYYELSAQSWLMSPCFDLTSLNAPWISFKVFWEVERTYDGAVLQYSLDGGSSWQNVGAYGDQPDCLTQNWYNTSSITYLTTATPKNGWSGRQGVTVGSCAGGQGSGGWVTASHCLAGLAGQPLVRFRFLFGSGSYCNNYDGFAVDAVHIGEAAPPPLGIDQTCSGPQQVDLVAQGGCGGSTTWDFGDPASGAANTATGIAVTHVFSAPGTFTVTISQVTPCGNTIATTATVDLPALELLTTPATCGQANGTITSAVTGGTGPLSYLWQPGGATTADLTDLSAGEWTLTATDQSGCAVSASATVADNGSSLAVSVSHTDVTCFGLNNGTAMAAITGSTPASILWSPLGGDQASATGLAPGDYSVTVTDANGCADTEGLTILEPAPLLVEVDPQVTACPGTTITLTAQTSGGTGAVELYWIPEGPDVSPGADTDFHVSAIDANGCVSDTAMISVIVPGAIIPALAVDAPSGCAPHCVTLQPGPPGMTYAFTFGDGESGADPVHCYNTPGLYDVVLTATDDAGCSGTTNFAALVDVLPTPVAGFAIPGTVIISSGPEPVVDASSGATAWRWELDGAHGDSLAAAPVLSFPEVRCYVLRQVVTNDPGCTDTAWANVCVEDEFALYAPDAFTPNGDGHNETFAVVTSVREPSFFRLRVFDRWGTALFTSTDPFVGWSGDGTAIGIYAWAVELLDSEGKPRKATGHVTLLR